MGAAIPHRHAETLGRANSNISPHFARAFQQSQGKNVGSDDTQSLVRVQGGHLVAEIQHLPIGAGVLKDRPEHGIGGQGFGRTCEHLNPQRFSARANDRNRLWVAVFIDKEGVCLSARRAFRHGHSFGSGGAFVQQRGIGDVHPGQIAHHGLIVEQGFQPPLRDFWLIRGIGGIPGGVFQNIAQDRGRGCGAIIPLPDKRGQHLILLRNLFHVEQSVALGHGGGPLQGLRLANLCRHCGVDQIL